MSFVKISWEKPLLTDPWTIQSIERSTTGAAGAYTVVATVASQAGVWVDQTGDQTYFYRSRFFDPVTGNYDVYTNPMQGGLSAGYLTLEEARRQGKFITTEFSDSELQDFINQATLRVDEMTGRTWQGILTFSNLTFDGSGTHFLQLPVADLHTLTYIAINNGGANWTTVTPSMVTLYPAGAIALDICQNPTLERPCFPKGYKNVQLSFTAGNAWPTDSIKELTLLFMMQKIRFDPTMDKIIESKVGKLRYTGMYLV